MILVGYEQPGVCRIDTVARHIAVFDFHLQCKAVFMPILAIRVRIMVSWLAGTLRLYGVECVGVWVIWLLLD